MESRDYVSAYGSFETAPADCAFTDRAYADVEQLLKIRLDNAKPEEMSPRLDALFAYYDKFDQINPGNAKGHLVRKAKAYKRYADDASSAYKMLERAYAQDRSNFGDAEALFDYFTGYHAQYAAGKVKDADLISRYGEISSRLASEMKTADRKQPYRFAMRGIDALMDRELTCEKLLPVYSKQYNENRDNVAWFAGAAALLGRKKCHADTLAARIFDRWYQLDKSPESAAALSESASLETDPLKKAEMLYRLAVRTATGDPGQADSLLSKALAANPKMGRAHLLRASLYANSNCGSNEFERKAMNFLAATEALKAASVQPELKATADSEAARYRANVPTPAEIKAAKMAGKSLKLNCWIKEPVNIPSK